MPENMKHVEHFVPKMYLRQFSESKKSLYRYHVNNLDKTPELKSFEKICREIDLYEIVDRDGEYFAPNMIENAFGKIEEKTGRIIKSIKNKAENEKCLNCLSFLSENEKSYLIIFMIALKFRDPKTIESGIKILQNINPNMNTRDARNFTLMNLLSLGIEKEWDKNTIIRSALENYSGMAFQIGLSDNDDIITSDRPVIEWPPAENDPFNRPKAVVFPLTSRLILYLYPIESVAQNCHNCFFKLDEKRIEDMQYNVATSAREWIFSKKPLTKEQMNNIREARIRLADPDNEKNVSFH